MKQQGKGGVDRLLRIMAIILVVAAFRSFARAAGAAICDYKDQHVWAAPLRLVGSKVILGYAPSVGAGMTSVELDALLLYWDPPSTDAIASRNAGSIGRGA